MADVRDPLMPGGLTAVQRGCRCPRLDNGHGNVSLARDRGGWVIFSDCPSGSVSAVVPPQPGSHPIPDANVDRHRERLERLLGDWVERYPDDALTVMTRDALAHPQKEADRA